MKLAYAAKIELKSRSGGTDAALYLSTHGGNFNNGTSVVHFAPLLSLNGPMRNEFGRNRDLYQVPGRLLFTLANNTGELRDYLPTGSDPQYWEGAAVTLYKADGVAEGAALSSMTVEFTGEISRGTFGFSTSVIDFEVEDIRAKANKPLVKEKWSQHAGYSAGAGVVDGNALIPVVLGDWTGSNARIPAYLIAVSGSNYVYAICNHECGSLVIYDADGNTITPSSTANLATRGEFTCTTAADGDYQVGEALYVAVKGYPTDLSDNNHVRLIQFILTQFGGASAANDIYNRIADSSNNERGSFRVLYDATGGSSPEYPVRAYVSDPSILAVNLAASVAYEGNAILSVVNDQYNIFYEVPLVASNIVDIEARFLAPEPLSQMSDPNDEFCTVIRAQYDYNPNGGAYLGFYDSAEDVTSGPIDDQRDRYRNDTTQTITAGDVVLDDGYIHVWDASTVARSVQRRLLWRIYMPQYLDVKGFVDSQTATHFDLSLYSDVDIQDSIFDGKLYRVMALAKDLNSGQISFRGLALGQLPTIGQWTNDDGEDGNGNTLASYWGDANGLDSNGNLVGSWF